MLSQFRCCWYNPKSDMSGYCEQCPQSTPHVDNSSPNAGHARLDCPVTTTRSPCRQLLMAQNTASLRLSKNKSGAVTAQPYLCTVLVLYSTVGRDTASNRNILKNSRKRAQDDLDQLIPALTSDECLRSTDLASSSKNAGRAEPCSDYNSEPMGHRVINSPTLKHTTCTQHQTWCGCGLNNGHVLEEQGFPGAMVFLLLLSNL